MHGCGGSLSSLIFPNLNRTDGLVVKAFASRAEDQVFEFRLDIGTPVNTLPGAWLTYRVSAGTCLPGVSIL